MNTVREYQVGSESSNRLTRWMNALLSAVRSVRIRNRKRTLQLCETLPLGDKRFLAVVRFNHQRLLIGATSQSICLLQQLDVSDAGATEVNGPRENRSQSADG
jgi:flagellar biogenesis protein FliO